MNPVPGKEGEEGSKSLLGRREGKREAGKRSPGAVWIAKSGLKLSLLCTEGSVYLPMLLHLLGPLQPPQAGCSLEGGPRPVYISVSPAVFTP